MDRTNLTHILSDQNFHIYIQLKLPGFAHSDWIDGRISSLRLFHMPKGRCGIFLKDDGLY